MCNNITEEMWDQRFSQRAYVYGKDPNDFLRMAISSTPPGNALCLADGEGRNGVYLAAKGFSVTSVDLSGAALKKATRLADAHGVEIRTIHEDLANYQIEEAKWDLIVSIFCHLPLALRKEVHRGVVNGLRKDGLFILEAYTPDQIPLQTGGPRTADLMMTVEALRSELSGLDFDHAIELKRKINEGSLHSGLSAVVQIIARKS